MNTKTTVRRLVLKNKILDKCEKKRINPYSPRNRKTKGAEEYSVLNPLTNSDSPSVRSNGARFVSAKMVTTQMKKIGKKEINPIDLLLTIIIPSFVNLLRSKDM